MATASLLRDNTSPLAAPLGFGLELRTDHYEALLGEQLGCVSWLEVLTDDPYATTIFRCWRHCSKNCTGHDPLPSRCRLTQHE